MDDEDDEFGEFVDAEKPVSHTTTADLSIPSDGQMTPGPPELLIMFHEKVFHMLDPFFANLAPLSYSQRRRVLSAAKTQRFFAQYFELITVCGYIVQGRKFRCHTDQELKQADREARHVLRTWIELSNRLKSLGIADVPDLERYMTQSANGKIEQLTSSSSCAICGCPNTSGSHRTCKAFWDHHDMFASRKK